MRRCRCWRPTARRRGAPPWSSPGAAPDLDAASVVSTFVTSQFCRALRLPPPIRSAPSCARLRTLTSGLLLRAVAAARLLTVRDARRVERAADDLVTHAGKVLHA